MKSTFPSDAEDHPISKDDVKTALNAVVNSQTFSGSDRLIGFLSYVVAEWLEGRGDDIRGKSIALDVYEYKPDEVERRESVVRVDAGRVRRKILEYYDDEGKDDSVQISLPKGRYTPVFETVAPNDAPNRFWAQSSPVLRSKPVLIGASLAIICAITFLVWNAREVAPIQPNEATEQMTRRSVLFETSPQRLEAINLAERGRDLIFPAFDPERLRAAMLIFETAINMDETYEGGYAGAAQLHGLIAVLNTDALVVDAALAQASEKASRALELEPDSAWALSAHAWTLFAKNNHDAGLLWSQKAIELAPQDPHVLEFEALISLYAGEFDRVIEVTQQAIASPSVDQGFVFQNARAAAFFHKKEYQNAFNSFELAVETGAPMGPVTVAYMSAASFFLGHEERARTLSKKYMDTWPDQRVDLLFTRLFKEEKYGEQLAQGMRAAGWEPN